MISCMEYIFCCQNIMFCCQSIASGSAANKKNNTKYKLVMIINKIEDNNKNKMFMLTSKLYIIATAYNISLNNTTKLHSDNKNYTCKICNKFFSKNTSSSDCLLEQDDNYIADLNDILIDHFKLCFDKNRHIFKCENLINTMYQEVVLSDFDI